MRVLLTGATGFTGRYMARALEARGHSYISLQADVTDAPAVRRAIEQAHCNAAVHLAGVAFVQLEDRDAFYRVNQLGTFNLLAALAEIHPHIPVVLASSANIYGNNSGGLLNEAMAPDPVNHYAVSKWAMEVGASLWSDRLRLTVVRPFNYTGVGQEDRYLMPKIVAHFRRRDPEIELGNLDVWRDFGDVRSVVDAYCGLIERGGEGVFNIATGTLHSIRDIIQCLSQMTGHKITVRTNPAFVRAQDVARLGGDPTLLRQALPDWSARTMEETLSWMLNDPS